MLTTTCITTVALTLALSAGTTLGQSAVSPSSDRRISQTDPTRVQPVTGTLVFIKGSDVIGTDVANPNDEVVASVTDCIVDRGSGRVEHVLLKSGDVLGIGGKTIAVPYSRLGFDPVAQRFELNMTKEQIDRAVAFVPENWSELQNTTWADKLDEWWYGEDDEATYETGATKAVASGPRETIKGTIESVDRSRVVGRGEHVAVNVRTTDGSRKVLLLGPSWYVMGHDAAPMRGDEIEAEAVRVADAAADERVVVSAKIGGDSLVLRDSAGQPRWRAVQGETDIRDTDAQPAGQSSPERKQSGGRLMRLSDLIGAEANSADKTGGEVNDVVIERNSGQIAIIGFDPNENLLGIADEIKVVPWSVVSIGADQKVRIDAGSSILKAAEKMPDDLNVYASPARLEPVYRTFEVQPVKFTPRAREEARGGMETGWGKDGFYSKAFKDAPETTITGRVTEVKTTSLREGMPAARVLVVSTDKGDHSVILGPEWYLKQQTPEIVSGTQVTIQGQKAKVGDKEYVCAHSVSADGRSLTLWERDQPMWDGR